VAQGREDKEGGASYVSRRGKVTLWRRKEGAMLEGFCGGQADFLLDF